MKLVYTIFIVLFLFQCAELMKLNHEGKYAWYTYNEGPTGNRCSNNNLCDGQRTCSYAGWCQGTSRPAKNANYRYDEAVTGNKCDVNNPNKNYYCDGNRTCSYAGWCQGTSR
jgi:hypothetical protein